MSLATLAGGRYRVERVLGSGGMAVVYLAYDDELNREVAVKVLADNLAGDAEFRRRFLREARVAARLSHPNVVGVLDAGEDGGRPYFVMEPVHGESLGAVLARRGRLEPAETLRLGVQAAAGLGHAHAHGLVHRDVKPHNLLLGRDGVLKVADFGIARPATATQQLTMAGTVLGTAAYLAPEQAAGEEVTAAADVYALGAVFYECLTGRTPYRADTLVQLVTAQQNGEIRPLRELAPATSPWLEEVVMRCLARNPGYRPASAGEVERLLRDASAEDETRPLPRPGRTARRRRGAGVHLHLHRTYVRIAAAAAALLAVGAIVAAAVLATSGAGSAPPPMPPDRPGHPAAQARDLAHWLRGDVSK